MENLIWIMLLVIALLIVDVIMLRQRVSKLQKLILNNKLLSLVIMFLKVLNILRF